MKFNLVVFSGNVPAWVSDGFNYYAKRFRVPYSLDLMYKDFNSPNELKNTRKKIEYLEECKGKQHYTIALDSKGVGYNTINFTSQVTKIGSMHSNISFFIGGVEGHTPDFIDEAHDSLSFSKLTFGHHIMIPLAAEILYRSYSLIIGHPYHRSKSR